ncbi:MBOAT family O-acyltransferase [Ferruginibacter albus]|uniref:MBOAT family O-acyltransferase n=1 Tax=Ferruginibacter albus TaxID=2875540 RepID=UPI001CC35EA8|nr:MBOAT family O-acyltransferase [Ferruginibacter albus]
MERTADQKKRKRILVISLIANISILAVFKYYNFINDNITGLASLLGFKNHIPYLHMILPIGLSFHTFQAMSYTIEVYRKNQHSEKHFGYYALYVMYYPQLVAGPIERPQNVLHQFKKKYFFDYDRVVSGLRQMLWGFFKKIVIADKFALFVNTYYSNLHETSSSSIFPILFFSIQIYCDFSSYSDIALGASRVMGIELMKNFNYPYFSASITEFWRRWHISLSSWFRDYVYIPLGGSQSSSKWKIYKNLMIVFMISGIWHGANWTFIVWGALHGLLVIAERIFKLDRNKGIPATLITFSIVSLIWVFFRAENFSQSLQIFNNLKYWNFKYSEGQEVGSLITYLGLILFLFVIEFIQNRKKVITIFELIKPKWARMICYVAIVEIILISFNKSIAQQFIYFQF